MPLRLPETHQPSLVNHDGCERTGTACHHGLDRRMAEKCRCFEGCPDYEPYVRTRKYIEPLSFMLRRNPFT